MDCYLCRAKDPTACTRRFCPVVTQRLVKQNIVKRIDKDFYGNSPPSIFIGSRLKHPEVNVGILSPLAGKDEAMQYDNPYHWIDGSYSIEEVAGLRSSLINSRTKTTVKSIREPSKLLSLMQEIGLAKKTVSVEIQLKKKLQAGLSFNQIHSPFGPSGNIEKAQAQENISISRQVDKVYSDTDLKAAPGLVHLYKRGFKEHQLTQFLSVGSLGLKKNRIFVPTRNSITATDDIITKNLLEDVRKFPVIDEYVLFEGNFFGNYYYILLFPEIWSFELFESYLPGSIWNFSETVEFGTDYEGFQGRKRYVKETAGGYYATRLPIVEYLHKRKKQASVLVVRFETPEYSVPLGVWVVRSASQKTMSNKFSKFSSKEALLKEVENKVFEKYKIRLDGIFGKSILLRTMKEQMKLFSF